MAKKTPLPAWLDDKEMMKATAEWAIRLIPAGQSGQRLAIFAEAIRKNRLDLTPEQLDRVAHSQRRTFDEEMGITYKDVEGQAGIVEALAVTPSHHDADDTEYPETEDSQHPLPTSRLDPESLAAGFRAFAEIVAPADQSLTYDYVPYAEPKLKALKAGQTWELMEGCGTVQTTDCGAVHYFTSILIGKADGVIRWAIPDVGRARQRHIPTGTKKGTWVVYAPRQIRTGTEVRMKYWQGIIKSGTAPHIIGSKALALMQRYTPGAMNHITQAELAKRAGLDSRQLLHHHAAGNERTIERKVSGNKKAVDVTAGQ